MSSLIDTLHSWFRPTLVALFAPSLPLATRWRLLLLQPISLLAYALVSAPWLLSRPYTVERLPIGAGRSVRALVFRPRARAGRSGEEEEEDRRRRRPLHVDVHGGAFISGLPESDARFCALLAERTGAVVVSTSYRCAPEHGFPAAVDDVDAVVRHLLERADEYGVDPGLLTVSGFSAGGALALAASQAAPCRPPAATAIKGSVTFYAPVSRLSPSQRRWVLADEGGRWTCV
jgi:acetyl esterase/lipase